MRELVLALAVAAAIAAMSGGASYAQEDVPGLLGGAKESRFEVAETRVVALELDRAGRAFGAWSYVPLGEDVISLSAVDTVGHREIYRLQAGREYLFQGACDRACADVDLEILDAEGFSLVSSRNEVGWPVLAFSPARTGFYTIRIWPTRCGAEACYVGIRAYGGAH